MPRYRRGLRRERFLLQLLQYVRHAPLPKGIKTVCVSFQLKIHVSDMPRYRRGLRQQIQKEQQGVYGPTCPVTEGD